MWLFAARQSVHVTLMSVACGREKMLTMEWIEDNSLDVPTIACRGVNCEVWMSVARRNCLATTHRCPNKVFTMPFAEQVGQS